MHVAVFVAAFVPVAAALRSRFEPPAPLEVSRRLHALERAGPADILFFGSSHVHHGIDPEEFDRELRAAGHDLRSFNLGMNGARAHETQHFLERVLSVASPAPRFVVIEVDHWNPDVLDGNEYTRRAISWHAPSRIRPIAVSLAFEEMALVDRVRAGWRHGLHAVANLSSASTGSSWLHEAPVPHLLQTVEEIAAGRGYEPLGLDPRHASRRGRQRFLADLEGYRRRVRSIPQRNANEPDQPYDLHRVREQLDAVRAAGAEPVYLVTPIPRGTPRAYALARRGDVPVLFAFNDPDRYPDLYDPDHRQDRGHLNHEGARRFSRYFGERFAAWLDARETDVARGRGGLKDAGSR